MKYAIYVGFAMILGFVGPSAAHTQPPAVAQNCLTEVLPSPNLFEGRIAFEANSNLTERDGFWTVDGSGNFEPINERLERPDEGPLGRALTLNKGTFVPKLVIHDENNQPVDYLPWQHDWQSTGFWISDWTFNGELIVNKPFSPVPSKNGFTIINYKNELIFKSFSDFPFMLNAISARSPLSFRVSPAVDRVVYDAFFEELGRGLVLVDLPSKEVLWRTTANMDAFGVSWSSSAQYFAYTHHLGLVGAWPYYSEIYFMSKDGVEYNRTDFNREGLRYFQSHPVWSPDENYVVFRLWDHATYDPNVLNAGENIEGDVVVFDVQNNTTQNLCFPSSGFYGFSLFVWSPSGLSFAYVKGDGGEIVIANLQNQTFVELDAGANYTIPLLWQD